MKLYVTNGLHFSIPGRRMSAHWTKEAAEAAALAMVCDLARDVEEDMAITAAPADWRKALIQVQRVRFAQLADAEMAEDASEDELLEGTECTVWIDEHELADVQLVVNMTGGRW